MTFKNKLIQLIPGIILIVSTLYYYIPSLIYFSNRDDFSDSFFSLILPILAIAILVSLCVWFIFAFLPHKLVNFISALLMSSALLIWLQGDFFVTSYGMLDGSELDFERLDQRGNYEIIIIAIVLVLSLVFQKIFNKQLPFIVSLIALGQIGIVTYNAISEPNDKNKLEQANDEFFNYSSQKNVILIILDTFGGDYFSKIRKINPSVVDDFTGFVNYTDAISNYPATKGSVPSLLTGQMIPDDMKFNHFLKNIVPQIGLPYEFEKKGYLVSMISVYSWFDKIYKKMFMTDPLVDAGLLNKYYGYQLIDYSLFRTMPHYLKPSVFNSGAWRLSGSLANRTKIPNKRSEKGEYMLNLVTTKMKLASPQKRFKIVHVFLPHPALVFDKNCNKINGKGAPQELMVGQSQCALKKLNEYFNKLKKLDIYDSSFIAVISDHGSRIITDKSVHGFPSYFEMESSSTLFMVKGINQKSKFEDVDTPVSLIKLYDLFNKESLQDKKIDFLIDDDRKFYAFKNQDSIKNNYLADAPLYTVGKNNRDPKSWKLEKLVTHECPTKTLPLSIRFKKNGRENYCAKFGFANPDGKGSGTWTESDDIRIILKLDLSSKKKDSFINFTIKSKPFLSGRHNQLDVSWHINNTLIKTEQFTNKQTTITKLKIPINLIKSKKLIELKITTSKLVSSKEMYPMHNNDSRKLGLFMQSIEIN